MVDAGLIAFFILICLNNSLIAFFILVCLNNVHWLLVIMRFFFPELTEEDLP